MVGRPFALILAASLCLGLLAVLGPLFGPPQHIGQASQVTIAVGIDANPTGNTATAVGPIDACASLASDQTVAVDLFVTDVQGLAGWQGVLSYDNSVVSVVDANVRLFVAANPASEVASLSPDPLPDTDGAYALLVADLGDKTGESGNGVLARLTLQAVGPGTTALTLSNVLLGDPSAAPIGDVNGDTYFDGPLSGAEIRVDQSCPPATPLAVPSPAVTVEATPTAIGTPAATGTPQPAASPAAQPTPAAPAAEEEGNAVPWALIAGISAGAALAALALGFAYRRVLRRAR